MSLFKNAFDFVLEAPEAVPVVKPEDVAAVSASPDQDREAMAGQLQTAKPEDFDIKVAERQKQIDHVKNDQIIKLKEWVVEVDRIITFLNGTDTESMQSQLHAAPCDTAFENISRGEKKKIARLAADLSSLGESLKGYLISFNDK